MQFLHPPPPPPPLPSPLNPPSITTTLLPPPQNDDKKYDVGTFLQNVQNFSLQKVPCAREGILNGLALGSAIGGVRFLQSSELGCAVAPSPPLQDVAWLLARAELVLLSHSFWLPCTSRAHHERL